MNIQTLPATPASRGTAFSCHVYFTSQCSSPVLYTSSRAAVAKQSPEAKSMEQQQQQQEEEEQLREVDIAEEESSNKKMRPGAGGWLREHKVRDIVRDKRRLVEVPYTATLAQTVHSLMANGVVAAPVAAPPGHWIGAGGSMILESDKVTGTVRKHYIGMITMFDVLAHIAEEGEDADDRRGGGGEYAAQPERDLDRRMSVPVSAIIGHSLEGLSLWTLNPNTSILDCMETFSKGIHRALVPLESQANYATAVELVEASPGYKMLTQMDVLSFLREQGQELKDIISRSVQDLQAINENIFAVTKDTKVIDAIKSMRAAGLNAVPVVEDHDDGQILKDGKGKKLVETFSATDLRGCPVVLLQSWLSTSVMEFKEKLYMRASRDSIAPITINNPNPEMRKLVTCYPEMSLADVIELAVSNHVHRVWVVDSKGMLNGLISLTDMLRAIRSSVMQAEQELKDVVPPEHT